MGLDFQHDITICIDVGSSMESHLDRVKRDITDFRQSLMQAAEKRCMGALGESVRLIAYSSTGGSLLVTRLLELPSEEDRVARLIEGLQAEPDDVGDRGVMGLKAVELAVRGPWPRRTQYRVRQIVLLWTDHGCWSGDAGGYGAVDFDRLTDLWDNGPDMARHAKRLILFAPDDGGGWTGIANCWENAMLCPTLAGEDLEEDWLRQVVDVMVDQI